MPFWKRPKRKSQTPPPDTGQVQPAAKPRRSGPPAAMEVKLVAIEAVESGANRKDVAEVVGVSVETLNSWLRLYRDGGVSGLSRRASSISVRQQVTALDQKILAHRRDHPDHGVRRIRDELRRHEGVQVSAEKVRQTVNAAGVGNPPPVPHRRPPQVRRFERPLPNAMWQIDIFTFQLKRLYRVYLVGIIDDHSRYLVGWGLFRQQTAAAVLEVVNGALKEQVRQVIGPIASPDAIMLVPGLPKTRSGKIMRRILRKIAAGEYDGLGDVTTLADPSVVEKLIEGHKGLEG